MPERTPERKPDPPRPAGPLAVDTGLRWTDPVSKALRAILVKSDAPGLFVESTNPDATRPRLGGGGLARLGDRVVDLERAGEVESALLSAGWTWRPAFAAERDLLPGEAQPE